MQNKLTNSVNLDIISALTRKRNKNYDHIDVKDHLFYHFSSLMYFAGYINEAGDLNLRRFEVFMQELAKIDMEKFQDTYADLKYFEAKTGRRPNANERRDVSIIHFFIIIFVHFKIQLTHVAKER